MNNFTFCKHQALLEVLEVQFHRRTLLLGLCQLHFTTSRHSVKTNQQLYINIISSNSCQFWHWKWVLGSERGTIKKVTSLPTGDSCWIKKGGRQWVNPHGWRQCIELHSLSVFTLLTGWWERHSACNKLLQLSPKGHLACKNQCSTIVRSSFRTGGEEGSKDETANPGSPWNTAVKRSTSSRLL